MLFLCFILVFGLFQFLSVFFFFPFFFFFKKALLTVGGIVLNPRCQCSSGNSKWRGRWSLSEAPRVASAEDGARGREVVPPLTWAGIRQTGGEGQGSRPSSRHRSARIAKGVLTPHGRCGHILQRVLLSRLPKRCCRLLVFSRNLGRDDTGKRSASEMLNLSFP